MRNIILFLMLFVVACSPEDEQPVNRGELTDTVSVERCFVFIADTTWNDTIHIEY
jgi:hypothetical protein